MSPDFSKRNEWYDIPVIKNLNGEEMTYKDQRKKVLNSFENFDILCSKKTHLGRDIAVLVGTNAGVSENSMKRHGNYHFLMSRLLEFRVI
jgi:hypothetical protein